MNMIYLNGQFMPIEQARISPMDRGFLFGDGIYEVIPSYQGRMVGFALHMARLKQGLAALEIRLDMDTARWQGIIEQLLDANGKGNLGIYLHVSRGMETRRAHAYPDNLEPTVFAFTFEIPTEPVADASKTPVFRVVSEQDKRWKRCNIKSTALLGNIMHYRTGQKRQMNEVLLFNEANELTEAASCNVFVVTQGRIATPPLDHQLLPGITRHMLLDILRQYSELPVDERIISMDEVRSADEIWLTSSSKEVAPVVELDGKPVGQGKTGLIWQQAQALFSAHKYEY